MVTSGVRDTTATAYSTRISHMNERELNKIEKQFRLDSTCCHFLSCRNLISLVHIPHHTCISRELTSKRWSRQEGSFCQSANLVVYTTQRPLNSVSETMCCEGGRQKTSAARCQRFRASARSSPNITDQSHLGPRPAPALTFMSMRQRPRLSFLLDCPSCLCPFVPNG